MTVYRIRNGKKEEEVPANCNFVYRRDEGDTVTFRFDGLELLDVCILRRILTEAEDDMLSPDPKPEPRAV